MQFPHRLSRRSLITSALSGCASRYLLRAQDAPTFKTEVRVVSVFATVRNKKGEIVKNLTKDDFTLTENGTPQDIKYFAQQSNLPLTLGLLVDTSLSERRMIPEERDASYTFLQQVLRPEQDKAFLIHFDRDVELLQDLTSSRERLERALNLLQTPERSYASNGGGGWGGGMGRGGGMGGGRRRGGAVYRGGGTSLYDAIDLASTDVLAGKSGRKAIILLTDGDDNGSKLTLSDSVDAAQRVDALVYSIRIADDSNPMNRRFGGDRDEEGKEALRKISSQTGGGYYEVSREKSVAEIYSAIQDELRSQYSLGYTPNPLPVEPGFRRIAITAKGDGLTVQARDGYYTGG